MPRSLPFEDVSTQELNITSFAKTGITSKLLLGYFKYANFIAENFNHLFSFGGIPTIQLEPVHLPIGISFFTFQALSYIIDVYRRKIAPQSSAVDLALYIALFPQLIAGPIVRYTDIVEQLSERKIELDRFCSGVQRFIYGLSKKILLANPLAEIADSIFALSGSELTTPLAWLGALCYTLQIYHGFFLVLERTSAGKLQKRLWWPLQHILTCLIVVFGWVIFRCETLGKAGYYILAMLGGGGESMQEISFLFNLNSKQQTELAAAVVLAVPIYPGLVTIRKWALMNSSGFIRYSCHLSSSGVQFILSIVLLYFSIISLAAGAYNPFIYFRF